MCGIYALIKKVVDQKLLLIINQQTFGSGNQHNNSIVLNGASLKNIVH